MLTAETEIRSVGNESTRYKVLDALLLLLKEKPLSTISVTELAQRAGISRMTFYRNYDSVEDILRRRLRDVFEKYWYEDIIKDENDTYYGRKQLEHCFTYFYEYHDFLESLFGCGLADMFFDGLTEYTERKWCPEGDSTKRLELIAFSGIIFNLYKCWMLENYKTPINDMVDVVETICKNGIDKTIS